MRTNYLAETTGALLGRTLGQAVQIRCGAVLASRRCQIAHVMVRIL